MLSLQQQSERDRAALHCTRKPQVVVVLSFLEVWRLDGILQVTTLANAVFSCECAPTGMRCSSLP